MIINSYHINTWENTLTRFPFVKFGNDILRIPYHVSLETSIFKAIQLKLDCCLKKELVTKISLISYSYLKFYKDELGKSRYNKIFKLIY